MTGKEGACSAMAGHAGWLLWLLPLLLSSTIAKEVPHVSSCNFCMKCHVGDTPPINAARRSLQQKPHQSTKNHVGHDQELDVEQLLVPVAGESMERKHARRRQLRAWLKHSLQHFQQTDQEDHQQANHQQTPLTVTELASDDKAAGAQASRRVLAMKDLTPNNFLSTAFDTVPKQTLGNCSECWGCNTDLQLMSSEARFFNTTYINEKGATSNWLFKASTNATASGKAVIKVYCVPIAKRVGGKTPTCSPLTIFRNMQLHQALEHISEDCGLDDVLPKVWLGKVDAVIPNLGYHIRWWGLWQDMVQGVSLENFLHKGAPRRVPPEVLMDIMHNRLNKTQVVRAAIFDLLTSQCDRHSQNIFIGEQGELHLIDNEACLQSNWKNCGFDSIFIPGTQKQEIIRLSNQFVHKLVPASAAPHGATDPQLLLDYRCYLHGGKEDMGTDYPPKVMSCLKKISGMSIAEVQEHYGLPDTQPAKNLHTRATDMLTKGFEWAYKFGEPRNAPPKRYLIQEKCCRIAWTSGKFQCAHKSEPVFELPFGDPVTGRAWMKPRPDIGTFEGGASYNNTQPKPATVSEVKH